MTTDVMRFTQNKILIGLDTGIEWATPLGTVQLLDIGTGIKVILKDLYEEHYFNDIKQTMKFLNKEINKVVKQTMELLNKEINKVVNA